MPFGEIISGPPGSGKSTYCYGKHQLFTALHRPIHIVNLDPANDNIPYPCAIDIGELVKLEEVMDEYGLGPNGGLVWCMEYLESNFDWLEGKLGELGNENEGIGGREKDAYVLFDLPGQVELSTNHESVKRIVEKLGKIGFRLASVSLTDSHTITSASKYISALLLSLRSMLHLELPTINVLTKIDLIAGYGDLDFNLDFYTEVQDLSYLSNSLSNEFGEASEFHRGRFHELNMAIISLIEDYSLVGFETLAVEDKNSMLHLTHAIDRATGYVFIPPPSSSSGSAPGPPGTIDESHKPPSQQPNSYALFSSAAGPLPSASTLGGSESAANAATVRPYNVRDVQERWIDAREAYDAFERVKWRKEGEVVREEAARVRARGAEAAAQAPGAELDVAKDTGAGKRKGDGSGMRGRNTPTRSRS